MDQLTNYEGLHASHLAELNLSSAIREPEIRMRGYLTVTADKLPPQFADYQRRDGLLIPIRTVRGKIESFQLKPFEPRIGKNGKPIKYETAANAPQVLDCPAQTLKHLGDPSRLLVITEGAKKVDSAISHKLDCVIGLQGVYGWRGTNDKGGKTVLPDWEMIALNGRQVLIAFDSDVMTKPSVRDALERLAGFLRSKGAKPGFLTLPNLPNGDKCGLDDYFASGKTPQSLQQYIVKDLPPLKSLASPETLTDRTIWPVLTPVSEIEAKPIDWLWPGWLPKGMLTLLGGYAGDGKSTLTMSLAATLSNGGTLPDGSQAPETKTLLLVAEDDHAHVVRPRLEVHNANVENISMLTAVGRSDGEKRNFNLRHDIDALRQAVTQENIGLVIIDPLSSYLANGDRNNEGDVRDTLQPLNTLMESTGCAVLGVMHIGKTDGRARAYQNLMGSTAFTALARCVWMVNKLPDEFQVDGTAEMKVLGVDKSNYGVPPKALQYCRPLDSAVEFHGESPIRIDESFTWKPKVEKPATEVSKAEEWLLEFMNGRRMLASDIEAAAKAEGFSRSNLYRAKKSLEIKSVRTGGTAYWDSGVAA